MANSSRVQWNHVPDRIPIPTNPLWTWPVDVVAAARWWWALWSPVSSVSPAIIALAVGTYVWASPGLIAAADPGWWVAGIWFKNAVLLTLLAQGLHLVFHQYQWQGRGRKFDPRPYPRKSRAFTFGNQYLDNLFWSLASGVTVWSAFESLIWWAMANGIAPVWHWSDGAVWFVAAFLLIPVWESVYFYGIHRLLHSKMLYRFHALHHRNTDIGPWSGLSMHPVEHVLYFGTAVIHFIVPTHPVHMIAHLMFFGLYAITTHTGYEGFWRRGRKVLHLGNFHHQMHHRFFEVNYGTMEIPVDRWAGTFHDGTDTAHDRMRERIREKAAARQNLP